MSPRPLRQLFDAMYHGKYQFEEFLQLQAAEHYTPVKWRRRTIYKASPTLRDFHYFLNGFLLDHLPVNETVSFAYRKGTSLHDAVAPHRSSRAFYQTDLEKFFDSISASMVRAALEKADTPVADLADHIDHIVSLITVEGTLPIGFSTSPTLSNACLLGFDAALASLSKDRQWIYTRYADDIVISAQERESLRDASSVVRDCLAGELGEAFHVNQKKSKLTTIGRKVKVLGLVILPTGQIVIDREVREKIEYQLHFYVTDRNRLAKIFLETSDESIEDGLERLSGLISYAYAAAPDYLEKLRVKFGTTVIDSLLHRSAT
jgi:RNA-directed DNA polymerase